MARLLLFAFLAFAAAGLWSGAVASTNLSREEPTAARRVFLLGRLAGPRYFTARGWRYRNLSLVFQALALASALGWVLLSERS